MLPTLCLKRIVDCNKTTTKSGNVGVVNTLIEAGCCSIAKTTTNGDVATALDFAADDGHGHACVVLLWCSFCISKLK